MSWPSLDSWRQYLFNQEDIVAVKPLNKKRTVWLTKYQGRQLVFKMTDDRSARYNQGVCLNSFATLRRTLGKEHCRVYVPAIFAPLGEAAVARNGVEVSYSAFLMDFHCGASLDILIDQLVEFRHEASIELIVELASCVENVARILAELGRTPKQGAVPDLKDTLFDIESGQTTLLDYSSSRTKQMALDVLFRWLERLQELCSLHKLSPIDALDKNDPPTEFDYCARLASAFKLDLQQASRQQMRKLLLGKRVKQMSKANKHWNSAHLSPEELHSRPATPQSTSSELFTHADYESTMSDTPKEKSSVSWPGSPRPRVPHGNKSSLFSESSSIGGTTDSSGSTVMADRSMGHVSSWDSV